MFFAHFYLFSGFFLVLASDHSGCLTVLMKTPYCRRDAKVVVQEARHMRDTRVSIQCIYPVYLVSIEHQC